MHRDIARLLVILAVVRVLVLAACPAPVPQRIWPKHEQDRHLRHCTTRRRPAAPRPCRYPVTDPSLELKITNSNDVTSPQSGPGQCYSRPADSQPTARVHRTAEGRVSPEPPRTTACEQRTGSGLSGTLRKEFLPSGANSPEPRGRQLTTDNSAAPPGAIPVRPRHNKNVRHRAPLQGHAPLKVPAVTRRRTAPLSLGPSRRGAVGGAPSAAERVVVADAVAETGSQGRRKTVCWLEF